MTLTALALAHHDPEGRTVAAVERLRDQLRRLFPLVALNATDATHPRVLDAFASQLGATVTTHPSNEATIGHARRDAVESALSLGAEQVLYSDADHILRWIEARPDEVEAALELPDTDLLVIGRTASALAAGPRRLSATEQVINHIYSLMHPGRAWDLMFAIRRMSRGAARLVVETCREPTVANDVTWPLLAESHGLEVGYFAADGLSYRVIGDFDRGPDALDGDPELWIRRVEIAADHASAMRPFLS